MMKKKKSKGLKYDGGKAPLYLISTYAMEELAKVLDFGQRKYAPFNWANGLHYSRVISAAKRHIANWEERQDIDPESNCHHLAAALCNLMFILDYNARGLAHLDDRRPVHTLKKKSK